MSVLELSQNFCIGVLHLLSSILIGLFLCGLFNDTVSSLNYIALSDRMINE
jgi:hypothetical protein